MEGEHSFEGDNYETKKIKKIKCGSKNNKETKKDDKKENYERYEDLSSDWEEIKEAKYYIKLKEKAARRYPKIGNNKKRYKLDDDEEFEKRM